MWNGVEAYVWSSVQKYETKQPVKMYGAQWKMCLKCLSSIAKRRLVEPCGTLWKLLLAIVTNKIADRNMLWDIVELRVGHFAKHWKTACMTLWGIMETSCRCVWQMLVEAILGNVFDGRAIKALVEADS